MIRVLSNKDINIEAWEALLNNSSHSTPFQTPEFYNICRITGGMDAVVMAIEKGNVYTALMVVVIQREKGIKGFFSGRGIIFGGPVLHKDCKEEVATLLKETVKQLKGRVIYLETRNLSDYSNYRHYFEYAGWTYQSYLNLRSNMSGVKRDTILSLLKYNRRREIKISVKNGAGYFNTTEDKDIEGVYGILNDLYTEQVRLPLPPLDYFTEFIRSGLMKVFVVKHDGKIIGGAFCPVYREKAIYTYYYCGIRNYNSQIYPTHLAVLAVMEYAVDNNITAVDFMGAGKPGKEYGVRRYKQGFGGDLIEEGRFIRIEKPFMYSLGRLGLKIMGKIKL